MTRNFRDDGYIDKGKLTDSNLRKLLRAKSSDFKGVVVRFRRAKVEIEPDKWTQYAPEDLEISESDMADRIAANVRAIATRVLGER